MSYEEAIEWLRGQRSLTNMVTIEPRETWMERIARADAGMIEQAYWIARARKESLVDAQAEVRNK